MTDVRHRALLAAEAERLGGADLLVNNASTLGASPLPAFADLDPAVYLRLLDTNVVAPLALVRDLLPQLRPRHGVVLNVTSDASVEAYETWGGYGSSKAALDHASRVLAAEEPALRVYAVDPGDMRTAMHQAAFPGEDISDRPTPSSVVPRLLDLLAARPAVRAVPRGGRRRDGGTGMSSDPDFTFRLPRSRSRRRPRRRPAAWRATRCGWPWSGRPGSPMRRRATCRHTCSPATCWS